jgi:transcription-repair coupling factor
VRRCIISRNY